MTQPALVLLVKFKSQLPLDEIRDVIESRAEEFRALTGLQQKYYLEEPATGEIAGLYLWESSDGLNAYRESALRSTIAAAYQALGEPRVEVFSVLKILRE